MMHCRMCSQRLTRPGRLCRECECELQRARYAGASIGDVAPVIGAPETSRMASVLGLARVRAPRSIVAVALAFAVGVAGTVSVHVARDSEAATPRNSVMLGPEENAGRRVSIVSEGAASAEAASQAVPVAAAATVSVSSATPKALRAPPAPTPRVRAPAQRQEAVLASDDTPVPASANPSAGPGNPPDPDRALGDELARCGDEPFLARPDCEQAARARYCDAAAPLPQCVAVRETGQ